MWERLEQQELKRLTRRMPGGLAGERPDPARPAGADLLPQIEHIVVLMMENHSYDNYLGLLGRGDGLPRGRDGEPDAANPDAAGEPVRAFRLPATRQQPQAPTQSWHATHLQWNEGKLDGFVTSTQQVQPNRDPKLAMGYWTGADLPFYHGLAATFPLADRWFGSCLGPTFPNRRFLIAGTAHGLIDDLPYNLLDYPPAGTIFDLLSRNGISWVNYHPVPGDLSAWRRYARYRKRMAVRRLRSLAQGFHGASRDIQKDLQFTADIFPLGIARYMLHVRSTDEFFAAADAGTLPAVSFVDPDFSSFSEENPQDIQRGESFAAEVIRRVMHGQGWPRTLLIWLYDEHGGYYDHVPPPAAAPPDDVPGHGLATSAPWLRVFLRTFFPGYLRSVRNLDNGPQSYDRYGFRVPAVMVSPYARRDCVLSDTFDHTSVLKLIERKWNLPALTRRDAAAAAPLAALDFDSPPAFLDPPDLPAPALPWGTW